MENQKKVLTPEQRQILISELKKATEECVAHVREYINIIQETNLQNEQFAINFADLLNIQSGRI